MGKISLSLKIYICLVAALAVLTAVYVLLPQGSFSPAIPEQELPASKPVLALVNAAMMLVIYGGLGFLGLKLSAKLGFADIWDSEVSNKQRFLTPALIGAALGVFFILADLGFSQLHTLGALIHPPFPASLVASAVAGIGEELIFRLFFISFWVWLVSEVILKKRLRAQVFWVVAVFSAVVFAAGHIPSAMLLFGFNAVNEIPIALMSEIFLLNGVLSLFAAYYFRKYGFLAAVGIHFWTDVVWHVIWGLISS